MVKEKGHQTLKLNREVKQLDSVLDAIGAHNPSAWLPILMTVAPFIARIAIRSILRKMGKTVSDEKIEGTVDLVKGIIERIGAKGSQTSTKKKK